MNTTFIDHVQQSAENIRRAVDRDDWRGVVRAVTQLQGELGISRQELTDIATRGLGLDAAKLNRLFGIAWFIKDLFSVNGFYCTT